MVYSQSHEHQDTHPPPGPKGLDSDWEGGGVCVGLLAMKKNTVRHWKVGALAGLLQERRQTAIGIVVSLWEWAGEFTPRGDIGRVPNAAIADGISWDGDPDGLIDALVEAGWVDRDDAHRLVIHDWAEHCQRWVRQRLERDKLEFVTPTPAVSDDAAEGCSMDTQRAPSERPTADPGLVWSGLDRSGQDRHSTRARACEAPDGHQPSGAGSAERYAMRTLTQRVVDAAPPRMRGRPAGVHRAAADAIIRLICRPEHETQETASSWLCDRVRDYADSPLGQSRFAGALPRWLDEDGFDAPDEAWQREGEAVAAAEYDPTRWELPGADE